MWARQRHGFTLIELLTVIAVMATIAGVFGLVLRDGGSAVALQSAQGAVASLLVAARGEAALSQNRVILVVDADPAGEHFLRRIRIAVETSPLSERWRFAGEGVILPRGIYIVPASGTVSGATYPPSDGAAEGWPDRRRSSLEMAAAGSISAPADEPAGQYLRLSLPLTALGLSGVGGSDQLVLAAARSTSAGVEFEHPERVRGVALSSYGLAIMVNDGPGFDF